MEIVLIAAVAENGVIGSNGQIPWRFSADMQHFKELTLHHPVIMGRKTYESIPERFRPLVDRVNIVLSRQKREYHAEVYVVSSLDEAINTAQREVSMVRKRDEGSSSDINNIEMVYIIGGESLYQQAMPLAQRLEITHVHRFVTGDTFFPPIDVSQWKEDKREDREEFSFTRYLRK